MPGKNILILEPPGGPWGIFLKDYFSDTPALVHCLHDFNQAAGIFDRLLPDLVFLDPESLNKVFLQKIKVRKHTHPDFRIYQLGGKLIHSKELVFDALFPSVPVLSEFNRHFVETLPFPPSVRLLVVDDEEEIGNLVRDYFEGRQSPSFFIEQAMNGKEAFEAISKRKPDVMILDVKMPVMDGREFYAKLQAQKMGIPVIIFFDSISGEELLAIRQHGNPAVVEKGHSASILPFLLALVKKLVYFGPGTTDPKPQTQDRGKKT